MRWQRIACCVEYREHDSVGLGIEEHSFCVSSAHWERIRPLESLVCLFLVHFHIQSLIQST